MELNNEEFDQFVMQLDNIEQNYNQQNRPSQANDSKKEDDDAYYNILYTRELAV